MNSKLPHQGTTIFTVMSSLAAEHNALNLSQGFPDYNGPLALREALARNALEGNNQYAPMVGLFELREQIAKKLTHFYTISANLETEITVLPGATEAIYCAITACVQQGDEVIVFDPCYDSYQPSITLAGGLTRHIPLDLPDFSVDWQRVKETINDRTRMVIINSPHNPSGSILSHEDMLQLQALVADKDMYVLSDEVYEHLVFDGNAHRSVLQYPQLREQSFAVFSFGKTFHITGWKTGYCVAPAKLSTELRKVHQFVTFVAVTPIQQALADFMAQEPDFPAGLAKFYQKKRDLFCEQVETSRFLFTPSHGTYFQLLDYSEISKELDSALATRLAPEAGIASIPISVFCKEEFPGYYLRFCFAKSESMLERAAEVLCKI